MKAIVLTASHFIKTLPISTKNYDILLLNAYCEKHTSICTVSTESLLLPHCVLLLPIKVLMCVGSLLAVCFLVSMISLRKGELVAYLYCVVALCVR